MIDSQSEHYEVVIIGAGPAGSVAAISLARAGKRVLLVEKKAFPRFKVCGCCLNPNALRTLESLDLVKHLRRKDAVDVDQFRLRSHGRQLIVPLPGGMILSRQTMDQTLVDVAVEAGVDFLDRHDATVLPEQTPEADMVFVELNAQAGNTRVISAGHVLVADGLSGSSLKRRPEFQSDVAKSSYYGVSAHLPENSHPLLEPGTIEMAVGRSGYVGCVVLEDGSINYSSAVSPEALRSHDSTGDLIATILQEAGAHLPNELTAVEWQGVPHLTRTRTNFAARRILLLGDATGYVEPFTGEGMAWAAEMGVAAAELLLTAEARSFDVASAWRETVLNLRSRRQVWCRRLSAFLRHSNLVHFGLIFGRLIPSIPTWIVSQLYESHQSVISDEFTDPVALSEKSGHHASSASH
ncbi:MAG: NAD(P)/FAD-dependent oxidoreductase [Planctomycetaceae bacterium]|nr:NAD(P)/FAD-dependent oxidoreductase [Planctomycetaceae bacterium]